MLLLQEGYTVHIGGLMRLDIDEASVDSLYVTVWASPYVPLHMGKKENAYKTLEDHFGCRLQVKLWPFQLCKTEYDQFMY